jgi:hypothetical protein
MGFKFFFKSRVRSDETPPDMRCFRDFLFYYQRSYALFAQPGWNRFHSANMRIDCLASIAACRKREPIVQGGNLQAIAVLHDTITIFIRSLFLSTVK